MQSLELKNNIKIFYWSELFRAGMFQWAIWFDFQRGFLDGNQIAFFGAVILIAEVTAQIPTGAFADIFGKKLTLFLGNFFAGIGSLILGLYPSSLSMYVFAFALGIGNAFLSGTHSSLMYNKLREENCVDLYPKIKANGSVLFQTFGALSIVIGSYLYKIDDALPYVARAIASFAGVYLAFKIIDDRVDKSKFNVKQFLKQNALGFMAIFRTRIIALLTIFYVLIAGIAYTSQRFLTNPYMSEIGLDAEGKGWVAMILKIMVSLIGFAIVRNKKIFENKFFLLLLPIIQIAILLPLAYFQWPFALIFLFGIAFVSSNVDLFLSPAVNEHLHSSLRTTALSALSMLTALLNSFTQYMSGYYVDNLLVSEYYRILGLVILFLALPISLVLLKSRSSKNIDETLAIDEKTV